MRRAPVLGLVLLLAACATGHAPPRPRAVTYDELRDQLRHSMDALEPELAVAWAEVIDPEPTEVRSARLAGDDVLIETVQQQLHAHRRVSGGFDWLMDLHPEQLPVSGLATSSTRTFVVSGHLLFVLDDVGNVLSKIAVDWRPAADPAANQTHVFAGLDDGRFVARWLLENPHGPQVVAVNRWGVVVVAGEEPRSPRIPRARVSGLPDTPSSGGRR